MTGPWVCATGVHQVHRSTKASVLHVPTRSERFKDRRGGEFERRRRVTAIGYTDRVLANYSCSFRSSCKPKQYPRGQTPDFFLHPASRIRTPLYCLAASRLPRSVPAAEGVGMQTRFSVITGRRCPSITTAVRGPLIQMDSQFRREGRPRTTIPNPRIPAIKPTTQFSAIRG